MTLATSKTEDGSTILAFTHGCKVTITATDACPNVTEDIIDDDGPPISAEERELELFNNQFREKRIKIWTEYGRQKRNALCNRASDSPEYQEDLARVVANYEKEMTILIDAFSWKEGFKPNFENRVVEAEVSHYRKTTEGQSHHRKTTNDHSFNDLDDATRLRAINFVVFLLLLGWAVGWTGGFWFARNFQLMYTGNAAPPTR
ncbi:hypothetical protein F4808DRAFT_267731 [Astrocystis sublimbata]|nr:hypothetical protein F4808DRAFT_267731 [Astrocystis sublimbata]